MYLSQFNFADSPFSGRSVAPHFFPSDTHQEALARLEFLVANRRALGLLLGPPGTGKSTVLQRLAQQLRRRGCVAVSAGLSGLSSRDLVEELTLRLGCGQRSESSFGQLWIRLSDILVESRRLQRQTVFLLDDADLASQEIQAFLVRLLHADSSPEARHTLILACEVSHRDNLSQRLLDRVDLRVDLDPWSEADTAAFLQAALANSGCHENLFDAEAIGHIHDLSGGIPRQVNRLADLSLVAAAGQRCSHVDGETVAAVAGELVAC